MAKPDRTRKIHVRDVRFRTAPGCEVAYAITQLKTRITEVRIAVAKFESTPATPTLARTAVAPAKTAESSDQ